MSGLSSEGATLGDPNLLLPEMGGFGVWDSGSETPEMEVTDLILILSLSDSTGFGEGGASPGSRSSGVTLFTGEEVRLDQKE